MTAADLYRQIADLAPSIDPTRALELGDARVAELLTRNPEPHDAETCRLLSLAAIERNPPDFALARGWRERALDLFIRTGWHEGVGMVRMSNAFVALAQVNDDYAAGDTLDVITGSEEAVALMDEILPILEREPSGISVGPRSPSHEVLGRIYHEKRGFFLLALGRLDEARESYEKAADAAGQDLRGQVKVRLGAALVDYLAGARSLALASTRAAALDARELGLDGADLAEIGERNLAAMERGGNDLRPYEIL